MEKIYDPKQLFDNMQQELYNIQEWNDGNQLINLLDQNIKITLLYLYEAILKKNEESKKVWGENFLTIYRLLSSKSPRDSELDHYLYNIQAFLTPRLLKKNWKIVKKFIPNYYREPFIIEDVALSKLLIIHILKNYWQDSCFSFIAIIFHLSLRNSIEVPREPVKKLFKPLNEEGFNNYIAYFIRQNTGDEVKNNLILKLQNFLARYDSDIAATETELLQSSIYIALITSESEEFLADSWWKRSLFKNYYDIFVPKKSGQLIRVTNLAIQTFKKINHEKLEPIFNDIQGEESKQYIDKFNKVHEYFKLFKEEIDKYTINWHRCK